MTLSQARRLAYTIQALHGLYTGLYINVYIAAFGNAGQHAGLPLDPIVIGLTCLGVLFLIEYPLELLGGALADRVGPKPTFVASFLLRASFTAGLAVLSIWVPPTSVTFFLVITTCLLLNFAVAFTLLSGNFEIWLRSLCDTHEEGNVAFAWSETLFWAGIIVGGAVSILAFADTWGASFFSSTACAFVAAAICMLVRDRQPPHSEAAPHVQAQGSIRASIAGIWNLTAAAKPVLRRQLPDVDRAFFVLALVYGLAQIMEGLIPMYYVLVRGDDLVEKVFIVILCLWFPALLGAVSRTPHGRALLPWLSGSVSTTMQSLSIDELRVRSLRYALWAAGSLGTLLIPSTVVSAGALGVAIFFARVEYGPLRPLFRNYAASRIRATVTVGQKTVMSIGEQRMKLGAVFALVPFYLVRAVARPDDVLVWVLGVTAVLLAGVSVWLLRNGGED